ncbi:hypothetical protein AC249_AIPGENE21893 [Exaiptasia diaphana]|nr:hypothetical protein AC249_AIPGENE21893 [Exaiptasia diaphana]
MKAFKEMIFLRQCPSKRKSNFFEDCAIKKGCSGLGLSAGDKKTRTCSIVKQTQNKQTREREKPKLQKHRR